MKRKLTLRAALLMAFSALVVSSLTAGAGAVQGDKKIRLYDDCEPITFNEALGDGSCEIVGHTTIDEFFEELTATQDVHAWRNQPNQMQLNVGRPTSIENRGGEQHTFTPVAQFGGGFIRDLNELSGNPVPAPECLNFAEMVFLIPGEVLDGPLAGSSDLPVGTSRFQCCIHPWMRTTIEVAGNSAPAAPTKAKASSSHHH